VNSRPKMFFSAVTALSVILLTGCGSDSASGPTSSAGATTAPAPSSSSTPEESTASTDSTGESPSGSVEPPATESSSGPASSGSVAPPDNSEGTLTIWSDDKGAPALKAAAADFGALNGVKVDVQTISKDLQSTFVTASQADNGPDLVLGAHDWIGNLVQNGVIDPITMDDATQKLYNPLAIQGVSFNGQIYGIPFAVESIFLYRNTELAPDLPSSIEDMVSTGEALVKSGKTSEILSLPQGQNGDPYHAYPIFTAGGGTLFGKTPDGTYDPKQMELGSDASLAAAKKFAELGEKGSKALKRSITPDNALSLFTDKKTAFLVSGPWNLEAIKKSGIKYDISAIPGFEGGPAARPFIGVQALYVAAKGKNKALAQEFATNYFGTAPVAQALYEAYQRPPALLEAYDAVAAEDPDIAKQAEASKNGDILPSIPAMQSVWGPWGIAEAAVIGGADPTSSFTKAADTIKAAIK